MSDANRETAPPRAVERTMSFGEHLEELRARLLRSVIVLAVLTGLCLVFQDWLTERVALRPYDVARQRVLAGDGRDIGPLLTLDAAESFLFYFKVALYAAFVVGMPVFLFEMWRFVAAGLYPNERRGVMRVLPFSLLLFAGGVAFSYFVLVPTALSFLLSYGNPELIDNGLRLDSYLSFLLMLCLVLGAVFQLPLVQVVLARFGLVTPAAMSKHRRIFVFCAVIGSAIITPTGDAITMSLVAAPVLVLYEVGIRLARRVVARAGGSAEEGA